MSVIDLELVAGGCLSVDLFLHTLKTGDLYGLLNCGPEDNPRQVVGIPLRKAAGATGSNEYFRLQTHSPLILDAPPSTCSLESIRLQMEHRNRAPNPATQRCWLFVDGHKKINLKLESV